MSIEQSLNAKRLRALHESVQHLGLALKAHLPAIGGEVDNLINVLRAVEEECEHFKATAIHASTFGTFGHLGGSMNSEDLHALLTVYVPLLRSLDTEERFLVSGNSNSLTSYSKAYRLDLSALTGSRQGPVTRHVAFELTDHGIGNVRLEGVDYANLELLSFSVPYDPATYPLSEHAVLGVIKKILTALGGEDYYLPVEHLPGNYNRRLIRAHEAWLTADGREGNVVATSVADDRLGYRATITINPNASEGVRIDYHKISPMGHPQETLTLKSGYEVDQLQLIGPGRPGPRLIELSLRDRLRLVGLLNHVIAHLKDGHSLETGTDVTGRPMEWKVTPLSSIDPA